MKTHSGKLIAFEGIDGSGDARQILPTGIKAQIVITANLREWRHIFKLRCAPGAHWEIREVMLNLLKDLKQLIPVVFDDFEINEELKTANLKP